MVSKKPAAAARRRCFLDITIDGEEAGRIVIELFDDLVPRTAENFLMLCTGQAGIGKTTGKPLHYKGSLFHRVVKNFMIQGGDFSAGNGTGGESVYGGAFDDEAFAAKHAQSFMLSMANRGPDTNGSQFFITTKPAPHLDGKHVVFGKVISGEEVVTTIENLKVGDKDRPVQDVMISSCGQLVRKTDLKAKKIFATSSDEEDEQEESVEEDESETEKKKHRKKKDKKSRKKDESEEEGELEVEIVGKENTAADGQDPENISSVKPEDLPDVPETNKFLMRRSKTPENARSRRPPVERRGGGGGIRTMLTGHKVRGRGAIRFKPDSEDESRRSRSATPPHWRREESRLIKLKDLEQMKKERKEHDAEMKKRKRRYEEEDEERARDKLQREVLTLSTFGYRQPVFPTVKTTFEERGNRDRGESRREKEKERRRSRECSRDRNRDRESFRERADRERDRRSERDRDRYSRREASPERQRGGGRSDSTRDRELERREYERARRHSRDRRISPLKHTSPKRSERPDEFLRDPEREPHERRRLREEAERRDRRERRRRGSRSLSRSPIRNGYSSRNRPPSSSPSRNAASGTTTRRFTEHPTSGGEKQSKLGVVRNELELIAAMGKQQTEREKSSESSSSSSAASLNARSLERGGAPGNAKKMKEEVIHYSQLDEGPIDALDIDMGSLLDLPSSHESPTKRKVVADELTLGSTAGGLKPSSLHEPQEPHPIARKVFKLELSDEIETALAKSPLKKKFSEIIDAEKERALVSKSNYGEKSQFSELPQTEAIVEKQPLIGPMKSSQSENNQAKCASPLQPLQQRANGEKSDEPVQGEQASDESVPMDVESGDEEQKVSEFTPAIAQNATLDEPMEKAAPLRMKFSTVSKKVGGQQAEGERNTAAISQRRTELPKGFDAESDSDGDDRQQQQSSFEGTPKKKAEKSSRRRSSSSSSSSKRSSSRSSSHSEVEGSATSSPLKKSPLKKRSRTRSSSSSSSVASKRSRSASKASPSPAKAVKEPIVAKSRSASSASSVRRRSSSSSSSATSSVAARRKKSRSHTASSASSRSSSGSKSPVKKRVKSASSSPSSSSHSSTRRRSRRRSSSRSRSRRRTRSRSARRRSSGRRSRTRSRSRRRSSRGSRRRTRSRSARRRRSRSRSRSRSSRRRGRSSRSRSRRR